MVSKKIIALILLVGGATTVTLGALVYRVFFVRLTRVPTGGMALTILQGDHLVVNRSFGTIARGQIVVFQYRDDNASYVARVIGLPGERIHLRGRSVYINDKLLNEELVNVKPPGLETLDHPEVVSVSGNGPYRIFFHDDSESMTDDSTDDKDPNTFGITAPFVIPSDCYFMLGDNRANSYDSRYRGSVPRTLIWGTASLIYLSTSNSDEVRWDRMFKKVK
jgi:signal peptidase I